MNPTKISRLVLALVILGCGGASIVPLRAQGQSLEKSKIKQVKEKYKIRSQEVKEQSIMNMLPDDSGGTPLIRVSYPVYTNGYLLSGSVQGTVASGYAPVSFIKNAVVEGLNYPIPLATLSSTGYTPLGWEVQCQKSWYFDSVPFVLAVQFKFIYHHGYNTTTEWWSALPFASLNNMGRLVNHFGPHDANQGGQYNEMTAPVNFTDIPSRWQKGGTQVYAKANSSWWGDYGQSYLDKVELWSSQPSTYTNKTISFSQFLAKLPSDGSVNISIPGIGLLDYGCDFVGGTVSYNNISISNYTKTTTMVTYITDSELENEYNGDLTAFRSEMTSNMSYYAVPWPSMTTTQSQLNSLGGKPYIKIAIQAAN